MWPVFGTENTKADEKDVGYKDKIIRKSFGRQKQMFDILKHSQLEYLLND